MERLTDNTNYCSSWSDCDMAEGKCVFYGNCYDRKIYNKLREYEDLEEQGLLLALPCKVGDTVYCFDYPRTDVVVVVEDVVEKIEIWENGMSIETGWDIYRANDLGKTVFLTKAEAEKALAEMEKDCTNCRNYWQNTDTENECNGQDKPCHEFAEMEK